tara:strand:- start:1074 stop:1460 length:387 start_codon:yes stop_codon:yes gene_type:complete
MYKNNLWRAILAVMNSGSFLMLALNIDRLGNAVCSGDYRTTVSGRVGYFALVKKNRYWLVLQKVIDIAFYPTEGRKHCLRAYQWERGRGLSHRRGSDIALALLSILVIVACLILIPIVWLWSLVHRAR